MTVFRHGMPHSRLTTALLALTCCTAAAPAFAAGPPPTIEQNPAYEGGARSQSESPVPVSPPTGEATEKTRLEQLRDRPATGIDLPSALWLSGVRNLNLITARQRIVGRDAERQLAAAQFLPTLRAGMNYDNHTGALMQSSGNVLLIKRSSMFVGAGAGAVAAGTVSIPGVGWNMNLAEGFYNYLASEQLVAQQEFATRAQENETLRQVANAYLRLVEAEGKRALALLTLDEIRQIAKLTSSYAKAGTGRQADLERATTNVEVRQTELTQAELDSVAASARLVQLLNLEPAVRLVPADESVVPTPVVPEPIPLPELLAIATLNRPELSAQQASIQQAMLQLREKELLPFSPTVILMMSGGSFGGGSNIVSGQYVPPVAQKDVSSTGLAFGAPTNQPLYGNFGARADFDAITYWTLQNLGIGNLSQIRIARSRLNQADLDKLITLNQVRREVASTYVQTHTLYSMIESHEQAVRIAQQALIEDVIRIRGFKGLPIEVIRSQQLLAQARQNYLDAIIRYNQAHLDLFVALGQPPADTLARPVPEGYVPPAETSPAPAGGENNVPPPPSNNN